MPPNRSSSPPRYRRPADLIESPASSMGMNQHARGTAIKCLVHGIHLLSGHFGKPGDAPASLTGQPSACGTVREVGTLCHLLPGGRSVAKEEDRKQAEKFWNVPAGRIAAAPGHHTVAMFDAFCTPAEEQPEGTRPIDTLWVQVTNPGQTLPNLHRLFNRKEQLKDKFSSSRRSIRRLPCGSPI